MPTYVVGDIQGCYDPLRRLLDRCEFNPDKDQLWAVGDLVNRGPNSLGVVRFLRSLGPSFRSVLGNHDLHFLAVAHGTKKPKKKDTFQALLEAFDLQENAEWFRRLPLAIHAKGVVLVHAGVPPSWTLPQLMARAEEVETLLRGDQLNEFLVQMYGNEPPLYSEKLDPMGRARTITNCLTRMRFCTPGGTLDLEEKRAPKYAPAGTRPWYAHQNRALEGSRILFGHWASLNGELATPSLQALDTGCVWGNKLTALELSSLRRIQVSP